MTCREPCQLHNELACRQLPSVCLSVQLCGVLRHISSQVAYTLIKASRRSWLQAVDHTDDDLLYSFLIHGFLAPLSSVHTHLYLLFWVP